MYGYRLRAIRVSGNRGGGGELSHHPVVSGRAVMACMRQRAQDSVEPGLALAELASWRASSASPQPLTA